MKPRKIVLAILLMLATALPLFAGSPQGSPPATYCQTASRQIRLLAEKSLRAWIGLSRAAFHSPAIAPAPKEVTSGDGTDEGAPPKGGAKTVRPAGK